MKRRDGGRTDADGRTDSKGQVNKMDAVLIGQTICASPFGPNGDAIMRMNAIDGWRDACMEMEKEPLYGKCKM